MENVDLESENRSELHFDGIVGKSEAVRRVVKEIETVAPSDSIIRISGENGTPPGRSLSGRYGALAFDRRPHRPEKSAGGRSRISSPNRRVRSCWADFT